MKFISAAELRSKLDEARCMNEETIAFIESLQDEVQDLRDALSEARDSRSNQRIRLMPSASGMHE